MSREQTTIAILFADVCKSTQLFETHGDLRARELIAHALGIMTESTERYHGRVVKTIGDEVMSVIPTADKVVLAAVDMQRVLSQDPLMKEHQIGIKIGFHYGDVLEEHGDVFGDAVNVAARMVGSAKRDQIISNQETLGYLSPLTPARTRSLGFSKIRGKADMLELQEILWQEDTSSVTTVSKTLGHADLFSDVQLSLRFAGDVINLNDKTTGFSMGRDFRNELVVESEWVSRVHASIEFRTRSFVLIDSSTNGTYVQFDNEEPLFLQRDEITLRKQGVICLGQSIDLTNPLLLYFQCRY